jgi:membrane protease YdiL (CAAX protease family)
VPAITTVFRRHPQPIFWAIAWSTSCVGWYMNARYPSLLWAFMIWGPLVGGALVTAIADGPLATRVYFSRIVRWRVGWRWYLVALCLPLAIRLAALGLTLLSGATLATNAPLPAGPDLVFEVIFYVFFVALGEEPGFRGFALPRFMVGRSALAASLIVGVLHAIWHVPLFLFGGESAVTTVPIVIAGSVLFTWLFNNTGGSVLLAMILHASVDISLLFFAPLVTDTGASVQMTWLVVVFLATAALLVARYGRELGRRPDAVTGGPAGPRATVRRQP